jgi:hypothetical protein
VALPDFVIIGAPRAGTTALWRHLDAHPDISMSRYKELRFFNEGWHKGLDWYEKQFSDEGLRGEATPGYMYDRLALERMAKVIPSARLIVVLRDPVDRAYSQYWFRRGRGLESRSFADSAARYLKPGHYLPHLLNVCEFYPREALKVVVFEDDLVARPEATYRNLCRYLGVREIDHMVSKENSYQQFRSLRLRTFSRRLGTPSSPAPVKRLSNALGRLNARHPGYPPMDDSLRANLAAEFRSDNERLAAWLGRDLRWST